MIRKIRLNAQENIYSIFHKYANSPLDQVIWLILLYYILSNFYNWAIFFPEYIFHHFSIIWAGITTKKFILAILVSAFLCFQTFSLTWDKISSNHQLKKFWLGIVIMLIWTHALYPFNYYYGQFHLIERFLVSFFGLITLFRPALVSFFLISILLINKQFDYPIGINPEWTNRTIFYEVLILCQTWFFLHKTLQFSLKNFYFLLITLVLSHYFVAGIAKFYVSPNIYNWLTHNNLGNFAAAAYIHSWQVWDGSLNLATHFYQISWISPLLSLLVLIIELGSIFILFSLKWTVIFTLGRAIMHLAIFLLSGVFFWNWIILNLLLLLIIRQFYIKTSTQEIPIKIYAIILPLICLMVPSLFKPKYLGWFDSKLSIFYKMEVNYLSGKKEILPFFVFQPYDTHFMQSKFEFLENEKNLHLVLGGVYYFGLYEQINQVKTSSNLYDVKQFFGQNYYDSSKIRSFENFCRKFAAYKTTKKNYSLANFLEKISPIHHYQHYPHLPVNLRQDQVSKIRIIKNEFYFDGRKVIKHTKSPIWEISILPSKN
jgi:hypothetical protein